MLRLLIAENRAGPLVRAARPVSPMIFVSNEFHVTRPRLRES